MADVGVVIAVRNEEGSILRVLDSLEGQTYPPDVVVVVDDGSQDGTARIVRDRVSRSKFELTLVSLAHHQQSFVGRPELAGVFNAGLSVIRGRTPLPRYVMILGGDHALPSGYLAAIMSRMEADPRLAVAGGWIANEPYLEHAPRGSSMVVRTSFWNSAGALSFPRRYGWESWVYLKALALGYDTRSYKDVPTSVSRKTSITKGILYGRAMYALGYFWPYALGRCFLFGVRSPPAGVRVCAGFFAHQGVQRQDVAEWVSRYQRKQLAGRMFRVATRLGRR